MKHIGFFILAIAIWAAPTVARAEDKPNFTGTWTFDASKSDAPQAGRAGRGGGRGGRVDTTATVRGNAISTKEVRSLDAEGKVMTVEITITAARGERKTKQVYAKTLEK